MPTPASSAGSGEAPSGSATVTDEPSVAPSDPPARTTKPTRRSPSRATPKKPKGKGNLYDDRI
jgi:hypothetical protein